MNRKSIYVKQPEPLYSRRASTQANYVRQRMQIAYEEARQNMAHQQRPTSFSTRELIVVMFISVALGSFVGGFLF